MFAGLTNEQLVVAILAAVVTLALVIGAWVGYRRRTLSRSLERASLERLTDILVPNGEGGEIHIEHALLTSRGIVLLDIKDVDGNVFGSDSMQDWTVISAKRRFTFSNPQPALLDRLAAVRSLVDRMPVEGYVAFTSRGVFTKGRPTNVASLDELLDKLAEENRGAAIPDEHRADWEKLREEAVAAQVGHLLKSG